MLRWSLKLFRVRGIQLALHGSFFLLLAYVAWAGWTMRLSESEAPAHGRGVAWNVGIFLAFFTCVVLHELGHCFTAMRFGVNVRRILLMPIGGMAEFDSIPREPSREAVITLAGPAVNFVLAFGLWTIVPPMPVDAATFSVAGFVEELMYANLVMGCFNLIPAFPMDGGRLLRAVLAVRMPYLRATWWAATVGKVVCTAGMVCSVCAPQIGAYFFNVVVDPLWLPAALFAFIYAAGTIEYRAAQRRERDDAHWRHVLARLYASVPTDGEPPPLSP